MGRCNTITRLRDAIDAEPERSPLADAQALDLIASLLSGESWSADHLEQVADLVRASGRIVADSDT
jgi:hypothetical protein